MESEKEFKEELNTTLRLYKVAGIVIAVLLLIGVFYAINTGFKAPKEKPPVQEIKEPVQNITAPVQNITEQNITQNVTQNVTIEQNATKNITQNATPINVTNQTIPAPENKTVVKYTWETVTVNFPSTLKKLPPGATTHHYIEIIEADGTPATNGEQFYVVFLLDDHYGRTSEVIAGFENNKWLVTLILPNKGPYTLITSVKCADKNGHCKRLYPEGGIEKSTDFEVI